MGPAPTPAGASWTIPTTGSIFTTRRSTPAWPPPTCAGPSDLRRDRTCIKPVRHHLLVGFYVAVFDGVFPVLRVACFVVALALAAGLWKVFRWMFPSEGRLRVDIGDDSIQFRMPGSRTDVVRRADIELIVISEGRKAGVGSFRVYGPNEALHGIWVTNWVVKPPQLVMRVLKRHGYPYALMSSLYGTKLFYERPGRPVGESQ